jgi:hypothetical protein
LTPTDDDGRTSDRAVTAKICMIRAGVDREQGILGLDVGVFLLACQRNRCSTH